MQEPELKPAEVERLRGEALQCFRFALAHPADDVKIDELNVLRGCLAYLDWQVGDYYDAAVLGEFLARRYPDRQQGQQGADVARRAYAALLSGAAPGEDRQFESGRILSLARYASQRWPASAVADEAWMAAIRAAILNREPAKAAEYLAHIPPASPRRSDAELATGQALWSAYLEAMRLPETQQPPKADMTAMLAQARKTLEDGIGRQRKAIDAGQEVSHPLLAAVLSLAQIDLDLGEGEKAAGWLDDPKLGPHTLAKAENKAAGHGQFPRRDPEGGLAGLRGHPAVGQGPADHERPGEGRRRGQSHGDLHQPGPATRRVARPHPRGGEPAAGGQGGPRLRVVPGPHLRPARRGNHLQLALLGGRDADEPGLRGGSRGRTALAGGRRATIRRRRRSTAGSSSCAGPTRSSPRKPGRSRGSRSAWPAASASWASSTSRWTCWSKSSRPAKP